MQVFAISDIHGCAAAFAEALSLVDLSGENKLILCGDYIHGGGNDYEVLDRVISLEQQYGTDKVIVLAGNHEDMACDGRWQIGVSQFETNQTNAKNKTYLAWLQNLRRYYVVANTIFVHAGIDEEAEDWWEWGTDTFTFTEKYPAETGAFYMNIVAGHIGTAEISKNPSFHDIYFDGKSHYYIDGTVLQSGVLPVIQLDTETNQFYQVTKTGRYIISAYI